MEINVCPPWLLAKLGVPPAERPHLGVLLSSLLALTISPVLIRLPHFCLARKLLRDTLSRMRSDALLDRHCSFPA